MIGVFDSGSGGLTVLKAIRKRFPSVDVVYFGDVKNAPYGTKSRAELSELTFAGLKLLAERGATRIVSACNSVSASLALSLFDTSELTPDRLIEMVGPTVGYFRHATARLALVATPATIESGIYQGAFSMLGKEVKAVPIPELAGAIEFGASEAEVERIVASALGGLPKGSFDVLILACTHYPLMRELFERALGDSVLVFDPAEAVAERVEKNWWPQEAGEGTTHFLISADAPEFRARVAHLFPDAADAIEVIA